MKYRLKIDITLDCDPFPRWQLERGQKVADGDFNCILESLRDGMIAGDDIKVKSLQVITKHWTRALAKRKR